jgi:hypothetical protein
MPGIHQLAGPSRRVNISKGLRFSFYIPKPQVLKDFFNHILIFDKGNYPHRALAPGTYEGINLIDPG